MNSKNRSSLKEIQKNIGVWIRVSTEDQARGDSPEHHEQRARLYAQAQGYNVREVYKLDAVSGKSVMDHPETKRMLADVRTKRIDGLIFSKLARLARNTRELLDFADIFRENDAALISLQESLDTGTPAGRFFYTVIGALAEWERGEIADRVAASVAIRAKLGKPLGGKAPYGYQWKDKKLIPHPEEAPVRKLIYELYNEYRRKKTVVLQLNERGYRTRSGKKFSAKVLEDLIRDTTPKGQHRANYSTRRNGGRHEIKDEEEWVYTAVEPIVPPDLWEACNRALLDTKTGAAFPGPRPEHLFGGKVRCICGNKMYARKQTGKYTCDKCNLKIPAADLEAIYHSQLTGFLFSDAEIAAHLDRSDQTIAESEELLRSRTDERDRVKRDMDKLYDLHFSGEIPKEGFGAKYQPLDERLRQIEAERLDLQVQIDVGKIAKVNRDHMLSEARALHTRWPELSLENKRDIVQAITEEIIVGKEEVDIRLQYAPPLGNPAEKGTHQVGSPLGWLCTRMMAVAESSRARLMISRG
jgi:site-specific DNA recombinase